MANLSMLRMSWTDSPALVFHLPPFLPGRHPPTTLFLLLLWSNHLNPTPARHVCTSMLLFPSNIKLQELDLRWGQTKNTEKKGMNERERKGGKEWKNERKGKKDRKGKSHQPPESWGRLMRWHGQPQQASCWRRSMAIKLPALAPQCCPPDRQTLMQMNKKLKPVSTTHTNTTQHNTAQRK